MAIVRISDKTKRELDKLYPPRRFTYDAAIKDLLHAHHAVRILALAVLLLLGLLGLSIVY